MLRHRLIDRICCITLAVVLLAVCALMSASANGLLQSERSLGYEKRLFDQSRVHTLDIVMDDWEEFLQTCTNEEYASCTVLIDGESVGIAGIRAKGNTSLSSVAAYGNNRYSFKIEFDHYEPGKTYYGLDKLSLNNLIQDKTFLKDYLAYTLMARMGVSAPLCSFVKIRVNGESWGLYLAVEAIEDSFLQRNYGADSGELYKPDNMSMGGGRGNGRSFDMEDFAQRFSSTSDSETSDAPSSVPASPVPNDTTVPSEDIVENSAPSRTAGGFDASQMAGGFDASQTAGGFDPSQTAGGFDPSQTAGGFDPSQRAGGFDPSQTAGGFDPSQMAGGFDPSQTAGGFDPSQTAGGFDPSHMADGFDFFGMGGAMGGSDVMLQYIDDNPDSYSAIFSSAKTDVTKADQARLIASLKTLSEGTNIESAVDTEAVIRYLVVHNFLCNDDSYTGSMIHNYYLYEENGLLSMIPWDYNLAIGAFGMGGSDATSTVNSPIDSPVSSGDISSRPILSWIFESEEYTLRYHEVYAEFISCIYENNWLDEELQRVSQLIAPYIAQDKTAFFSSDEFLTAVESLRQFCTLRCESILGQLDGSIPSTAQAQRTDDSALIDGSHISLSDMGEFGMGGGRGFNRTDRTSSRKPSGSPDTSGRQSPSGSPDTSGRQSPSGSPDTSGRQSSSGVQAFRNEWRNPESSNASGQFRTGYSVPLLAACAAVLIAAILTARFCKSGR